MESNTKTAIGEFLESLKKLTYNTSDDWGFIHALHVAKGALDLDNECCDDVESAMKGVLDDMAALANWLLSFKDEDISIETRKRLEHVQIQSSLCNSARAAEIIGIEKT
jgi:hypothetical protein